MERLLILTDVEGVYTDWGKPSQRLLKSVSARDLDPASFAAGSMRPKIEAVRRFALETGHPAFIGRLDDAVSIMAGEAGTRVSP